MKQSNHRLGLQIKFLRGEKGISQVQLGKAVGLRQSSLVAIEQGKSETTVTKLVNIADYFGVSLDDLVGRSHPISNSDAIMTSQEKRLLKMYRALPSSDRELLCALLYTAYKRLPKQRDDDRIDT